jgi:hypothetical protein
VAARPLVATSRYPGGSNQRHDAQFTPLLDPLSNASDDTASGLEPLVIYDGAYLPLSEARRQLRQELPHTEHADYYSDRQIENALLRAAEHTADLLARLARMPPGKRKAFEGRVLEREREIVRQVRAAWRQMLVPPNDFLARYEHEGRLAEMKQAALVEHEEIERHERERRERCTGRKRSDLLAAERQSYQRREVTSEEWERGRDIYFLALLYDLGITGWLLDRLDDHDYIALKFHLATRIYQDGHERRRWLEPL